MLRNAFLIVTMCLVAVGFVFAEGAQEEEADYPSKPIRVIVPYDAGGGTDSHMRLLSQYMEEHLPEPLAIVNMGGGAGTIGGEEVLNAEPDGYTMLINLGTNVWTANFLGTADFGALDYELIAEGGAFYLVQTVRPDAPWENVADYVEAAEENPGEIREATNIGAITHFTTLGLQEATGAEFNLVHIGDGAERISNTVGGHVDGTIMGTHEAKEFLGSDDLNVIGVFAEERVEGYEDVPTTVEVGIDRTQIVPFWFFFPPGTPQERVDYMAGVIEETMNDPELQERLTEMGMLATYKRGEELVESADEMGDKLREVAEAYDLGEEEEEE